MKRKKIIYEMSLASMMIALAAMLKYLYIGTESFQLRFFAIPIMIVGYKCGLKLGLITAVGADLLYGLTLSAYPFDIVYTISITVWGFAGWMIGWVLKNEKNVRPAVKWCVWCGVIVACSLLETCMNIIIPYLYLGSSVSMKIFKIRLGILCAKLPFLIIITKLVSEKVLNYHQL